MWAHETKKRLFIALNFPDNINLALMRAIKPFQRQLPFARLTPPHNLHVTLVFLGYQNTTNEQRIVAALRRTTKNETQFPVHLSHIQYGPPGSSARMIWGVGESARLTTLKGSIEDALDQEGVSYNREPKEFRLHITLARFDKSHPTRTLSQMRISVRKVFMARRIELMESKLYKSGAEYSIVQSFPFARLSQAEATGSHIDTSRDAAEKT